MEKARIKGIIESVLFVSDRPVSTTKFTDIFGNDAEINQESLNDILNEMKDELGRNQERGLQIDFVGNGWQLRTKEENSLWIKKLENIKPIRLSQAALEVLVIVAYKQPISRADIDKIRGVDSSHLIRMLMDRGLIKLDGRSEELPGKPLVYSTTPEFLVTFSLKSLGDLPSQQEIEEIAAKSMGDAGDITGGLSELIKEAVNEPHDLQEEDKEDELLKETGKGVKLDIELVQEKVDLIFQEACKRYEDERKEKRGLRQEPEAYI
jgi:segregation and condensation protein B